MTPPRRPSWAMRLSTRLLGLALLIGASGTSIAQPDPAADELSGVVAGIIHYTRWPEPPAMLRLCIDARHELASDAGARRLTEALAALGPRGVKIESRRLESGPASVADCQALYVGDAPTTTWQPLLKHLLNQPVLTIGRGEDFCSWGGLFCLERPNAELRIRANLDSIARSGLRVNPQLLRMTQRDVKVAR